MNEFWLSFTSPIDGPQQQTKTVNRAVLKRLCLFRVTRFLYVDDCANILDDKIITSGKLRKKAAKQIR
jgi:hypothetical protein